MAPDTHTRLDKMLIGRKTFDIGSTVLDLLYTIHEKVPKLQVRSHLNGTLCPPWESAAVDC